ncbi:LacI family DNA-binding transcriptional regulator [Nitrospirillum pindoramense]|uniref:LacI family transcriptional regulator n=1 Tax=Nitrospirillum amazonense TaxID=28077 RepID=A0A560GZW3_9PROT|nr:LacI family DNA-binding transcriptional regulator [Nitrospirillum amazonense]TWB39583.1 LacI family transcriptional regulator [Nitrospirillum amazonense]
MAAGKTMMAEPGKATLQDVARLAGVSPATVSRVLNDPAKVAEGTTARVRHAILETQFVPNAVAVSLAHRRAREGGRAAPVPPGAGKVLPAGASGIVVAENSKTLPIQRAAKPPGVIAVITPALAEEAVAGVVEELAAHAMAALVIPAEREDAGLRRAVDAAMAYSPAGLVLAGLHGDAPVRRRLARAGLPVVEIGDLPGEPIDMAVGCSHRAAGQALARLLAGRGYRSPLLILERTGPSLAWLEGFRADFGARASGPLPHHVVPAGNAYAHGREIVADMLDLADGEQGRADVVACSSDGLALGALTEATSRGLRVPRELAVVGFGDADFAAHTHPRLSTIRLDARAMGQRAARLLLHRLEGGRPRQGPTPRPVDLGFSIVSRDSA